MKFTPSGLPSSSPSPRCRGARYLILCGMYLKISEPISLTSSAGGPATISLRSKCGVKIPLSPLEFTPHNPEGICAGLALPCLPDQ